MKNKICSIFGLVAFVIAPFAWADDEGGGGTQQPSIPRPDPNVAEFARGVKFTVAGYSATNTEVQVNFPVLVRLSTAISGFKYSDFYADGSDLSLIDIGFVDAEGHGLAYDIDTWNTNGESLVWVNLPIMTNNTEFAMWYRSSKTGKALNSDNVWADYTGVWHLNESGASGTVVNDSSTNVLVGAAQGKSVSVAAGRIGGSWRISDVYDRANAGIKIELDDAVKLAKVNGLGDTFSTSFWMKRVDGSLDTQWCVTGLNRRPDGSTAGWGTQIHDWVDKDNNKFSNQLRVYGNGGKNKYANTEKMTGFETVGQWNKIDVVWYNENGKGKMIVYRNGGNNKVGGGALNPNTPVSQPSSEPLVIGNFTNPTSDRAWSGELDEVRLIKGIPSAARVQADYDTVNSNAFLTAGSVVEVVVVERPVANLQVVDTGASHIQFGNAISSLGSSNATECVFNVKVWETAESEPAGYTELVTGLSVGALSGLVKGLTPATAYSYKIKVTNDEGVDSDEVTGTLTTSGVGVGGTGGDMTRVGDDWIHYFRVGFDEQGGITNAYVFTPPSYASSVRALVVGGGGPGGYYAGGGGGAGGYYYNDALGVTPGAAYTINVGTGGVAATSATVYGSNGGNSSIKGGSIDIEMDGGGAGGNGKLNNQATTLAGKNGGSGGGTAWTGYATGSGTADQGNDGGTIPSGQYQQNLAAGGGGASAVGGSIEFSDNDATKGSGVGGNGRSCDITGESLYYAGGGSGGAKAVITKTGTGIAGAGGNGGGGTGGQWNDVEGSQYATSGVDGFGGGGGGGSTYSTDSYQGGDGGDGIVIIRYVSQGDPSTVPEPIISLKTAVCNDTTFKGDVTFRVAWAGYNNQTGKAYETADVKAVWGYAANSLNRTNDLATGMIGLGSGAFPLMSDERTVYVRLLAVNAIGVSALSSETLSFYVNDNTNAVEEVLPSASDVGISRVDGAYATVTGLVDSAGMSHSLPSNCTVRVLWGTSPSALNRSAAGTFEVGAFSLDLEGLSAAMTYYYDVELEDDEGNVVAAVAGESFTTLGASVLNAATITSDQRLLTLTGSLSAVGGGVTYILVKWNDGEWEPIEQTFTPTSDTTNFVATFTTPKAWGEATTWAVMCSNVYVTVEGEPTGASAVSTPSSAVGTSGSFTPPDKATYTWRSVNGDWNGDWNDPAHWSSNKADCVGFPNSSGATVSFLNCTTNNPVVVTINGAYEAQFIRCFGQNNASDITFEGTARTSSKLTGRFADYQFNTKMFRSDSRLVFRNMTIACVNDEYEIMRDNLAVSNMTVRLDNVTATGKKYFALSAPYSRLEFVNATTVTCTKVSIGGTDTVCLIDDSTITLSEDFWAPADCTANNGLTVQFKGANPQIVTGTGNYGVRPHNSPGDYVRFEFAVPIGGYSLPPIQTPGNAKFAYANTNNANTPKYELVVDPDSPALKQASETFTNVLVYAAAGFYTNNMVEAIGTIPTHDYGSGDVPCGTFLWGSNGSPLEGEPPSVDNAQQILLELKGYGKRNGVIFLIY